MPRRKRINRSRKTPKSLREQHKELGMKKVYSRLETLTPGSTFIDVDDIDTKRYVVTPYKACTGRILVIDAFDDTIDFFMSKDTECYTTSTKAPNTPWEEMAINKDRKTLVKEIIQRYSNVEWLKGHNPKDEICPKCGDLSPQFKSRIWKENIQLKAKIKELEKRIKELEKK